MKINQVSNSDNKVYQNINSYNKTFKGIVNGKYYKDEIIMEAKKALKNPNWRDKFLTSKKTIEESLSTWHKREGNNNIGARVLMGIFTLGLTEITWGLAQVAQDASDNSDIDKKIEEIENCMEDLGKVSGND